MADNIEVREAIKEMASQELCILRAAVISSQDETDIQFRKEIDQELKIRGEVR